MNEMHCNLRFIDTEAQYLSSRAFAAQLQVQENLERLLRLRRQQNGKISHRQRKMLKEEEQIVFRRLDKAYTLQTSLKEAWFRTEHNRQVLAQHARMIPNHPNHPAHPLQYGHHPSSSKQLDMAPKYAAALTVPPPPQFCGATYHPTGMPEMGHHLAPTMGGSFPPNAYNNQYHQAWFQKLCVDKSHEQAYVSSVPTAQSITQAGCISSSFASSSESTDKDSLELSITETHPDIHLSPVSSVASADSLKSPGGGKGTQNETAPHHQIEMEDDGADSDERDIARRLRAIRIGRLQPGRSHSTDRRPSGTRLVVDRPGFERCQSVPPHQLVEYS